MNALNVGDTIMVEGEAVPVLSLEQNEYGIAVNEGQDPREFYLVSPEDSNGFTIQGLDDMPTYSKHGTTTLVIDPSATFTDAWDIDSEPVTVTGEAIADSIQNSPMDYFLPENTTVRIEGGKVVEINRCYVP